MLAAVYRGPLKITVEQVDAPQIDEGEVLIRVRAVGVCPTDVKIYKRGSNSVRSPIVLGHEVSGEVVESKDPAFQVGTRVNVAADAPCLTCSNCRRGLENICTSMLSIGMNVDGAYAEMMRVPREFLDRGLVLPLPDEVSWEEGALIEPVAVSLHALSLVRPRSQDLVVVVGDGPNALIHVKLLKGVFGVRKLVVVGMKDHRLRAAMDFGADRVIRVNELENESNSLLNEGVDVLDLTVSNRESVAEAMSLMTSGTRMVIFGGATLDVPLHVSANKVHYGQLTLTGSTGTTVNEYREAHRLLSGRKVDLRGLVSHRFSLSEVKKALEFAESQEGLKSVVIP
ncbi:alcohol dehydrogenase catalytic domain-containing protein [Sulfodiicoccus acidiphilus]|uniref:alcohol dehydrogenase catalytic domain-containing protein n=1 Tax=Sulfodiicoccus acidiphilus TaxID=1670455 RepID=UPI001315ABB3|nr:alcohol dehydrogenase catalytic domain-containing protein [Sulfodiicoccus acidiphilus]